MRDLKTTVRKNTNVLVASIPRQPPCRKEKRGAAGTNIGASASAISSKDDYRKRKKPSTSKTEGADEPLTTAHKTAHIVKDPIREGGEAGSLLESTGELDKAGEPIPEAVEAGTLTARLIGEEVGSECLTGVYAGGIPIESSRGDSQICLQKKLGCRH